MNSEEYANVFKALAHPVRLQIVCGLAHKCECCVNHMSEHLGVAQSVVSQHLNILKSAGIIKGYRTGNKICYRLENDLVKKLVYDLDIDLCSCVKD